MKLHPRPLLLLIYFASNSSIPGIDFFFRKGVYLISMPDYFFKESPYFGTSIRNNNTVEKHPENSQGDFAVFSCAIRNAMHFPCGKI